MTLDSNTAKEGGSKVRKVLMPAIGLLLLVFFPLMALYMSGSGLASYKALRAEMKAYKDSVAAPEIQLLDIYEKSAVSAATFREKVLIANFYSADNSNTQTLLAELKRVQSEFAQKTKKIRIFTYALQSDSAKLAELIQKEKIDSSGWTIALTNPEVLEKSIEAYKLTKEKSLYTFILVDRNGIVANYYDGRKKEEVNNMMKHSTILLPAKENRKKIKYEREKEVYK